MNVENFLFHTINKDSDNINLIYDIFENILLCGFLQSSNKRKNDVNKNTYNGNDYICLLKYVPLDDYKVYKMSEEEFEHSTFKNVYKSYSGYLDALKLPVFKTIPLSKQDFLVSNSDKTVRDYYKYLDSISNTYPIDLEILNKKYNNDIYKKIIDIYGKKNGYFNANENAFKKFVIESTGITLMFDKNINCDDTILIPNLPFEVESKLVKEINNYRDSERYSNLIGEVQVKEELSLSYLKGILINNSISRDRINKLLKKYNYNIKVFILNNNKLIEM